MGTLVVSSEERLIRPYVGVDNVQKILERFTVHFGENVIANGETVTASPLDYLTRPVGLSLGTDAASLEQTKRELLVTVDNLGLEPDAVELLVVLSTPRLKLSDIGWRRTLSELDTLSIDVPLATAATRPAALETPFGGCRIDVFLALKSKREKAILKPWRKGTWLAHVAFGISTQLGEIGFNPLPLDDEVRDRLGVAKSTNRVVKIEASVLDPEVTEDAIELYVDDGLLAELAHFSSTPGARALQRQLFLDVVTAIAVNAHALPEFRDMGFEEIDGSLLGRVVILATSSVADESAAERKARQHSMFSTARNDPTLFIAHLEAQCDTKADLSASLRVGALA
jgi:hypothetical protein